jgi:hypothetical protein
MKYLYYVNNRSPIHPDDKTGMVYWSSSYDEKFVGLYKNANLFIKIIETAESVLGYNEFLDLSLTKLINEPGAKFQLV